MREENDACGMGSTHQVSVRDALSSVRLAGGTVVSGDTWSAHLVCVRDTVGSVRLAGSTIVSADMWTACLVLECQDTVS